jgi:hypothetical protein
MERETGFEPATSSLGSWHSTTELLPPFGKSYSQLILKGSGIAGPSLQSLLSTVFRLFGRQNKRGQGQIVLPGRGACQLSHRLELHSTARKQNPINPRKSPTSEQRIKSEIPSSDKRSRCSSSAQPRPEPRYFCRTGALRDLTLGAILKEVTTRHISQTNSFLGELLMSTSPVFRLSAPQSGPYVFDHLSRSELWMTARKLASILSMSLNIYTYAERNMIPHFKVEPKRSHDDAP